MSRGLGDVYKRQVIDKAAHLATVDGKPMELSFKEFELLTYFLENQGIALSREKILFIYTVFRVLLKSTTVQRLYSHSAKSGKIALSNRFYLSYGYYSRDLCKICEHMTEKL